MENDFQELYSSEYFENRFTGQDLKREISYTQEYSRILNYVQKGKVLDIGCGMGNFLHTFGSDWERYGIEISEYAAKKAEASGIKIIDYNEKEDFFDLIVFRGVLQHLDTPMLNIKQAMKMLKPNGYIVFLATPNSNSIYYKLFSTLPMLDSSRNFVIPSDIMMKDSLTNFGLKVNKIIYPYLGTPYCSVVSDHLKFLGKCIGVNYKFSFWKNMMEIYAQKEEK